jgi:ketosteroid isomerase-like protein
MDRSEIEAFIKKFYAARVEGDLEALGRAFAADAKFQVAGSPEVSMLATAVEGHDDVMSLVRTMVDSFSLEDFRILDLLIDGGKVAVRWRASIHQVGSGETHETELADFIEVRDGKVASFIEFLDTALAG